MSNFLAIATVTAALRQMLDAALNGDINGTEVTTLPPDDPSLKNDAPRLNLYLYQVTPSAAWRNADLPTRRADGSQALKSQLGLNLHYLLTAYGKAAKDDPEVHRVLGSAVRALHEKPILTRDAIHGVLAQNSLSASDLAEQIEMVRLTPQSLTMEELSKLWSVFFQTPYRISMAYEASVVLIDGKETPRPSLPVRDRNIYVLPFRRPVIREVDPQIIECTPGAKIALKGQNMSADHVSIRFGTIETLPDPPLNDDHMVVTLPTSLRAGVNTVQVIHRLDMGTPPTLHRGFESNLSAFILAPRIVTPPPYSVECGTTLTLKCDPPIGRTQRVALLAGEYEIEIPARSAAGPATTVSLDFPIPAYFPIGTHLMRLRVDGAESALQVDPDPLNPFYIGPLLEVTP